MYLGRTGVTSQRSWVTCYASQLSGRSERAMRPDLPVGTVMVGQYSERESQFPVPFSGHRRECLLVEGLCSTFAGCRCGPFRGSHPSVIRATRILKFVSRSLSSHTPVVVLYGVRRTLEQSRRLAS